VQQKLFDKGLTAFDSNKDTREHAVKASITLTLDLLQENEETLLYYAISSYGIGTNISKQVLLNKSCMNTEQFNKCIIVLWSHGLFTLSRVNTFSLKYKVPCVEVHDVIAQYILDEMPYKFCKMMNFDSVGKGIDLYEYNTDEIMSGQKYIDWVDEYCIPFMINMLAVATRAGHMVFMENINNLIEVHPMLLETNTVINLFKETQPLPLKKVYKNIKDNCRILQSLLANNKHDEAIAWLSNHFDTHPCVATITKIDDFYHSLCKECCHDPELVAVIKQYGRTV